MSTACSVFQPASLKLNLSCVNHIIKTSTKPTIRVTSSCVFCLLGSWPRHLPTVSIDQTPYRHNGSVAAHETLELATGADAAASLSWNNQLWIASRTDGILAGMLILAAVDCLPLLWWCRLTFSFGSRTNANDTDAEAGVAATAAHWDAAADAAAEDEEEADPFAEGSSQLDSRSVSDGTFGSGSDTTFCRLKDRGNSVPNTASPVFTDGVRWNSGYSRLRIVRSEATALNRDDPFRWSVTTWSLTSLPSSRLLEIC